MSLKPNKLVLCGCGWLGGYLASHFASDMHVIGTTRNKTKAAELFERGITAIPFTLGDTPDELLAVSANSTFVLNIPPGRRNNDLSGYTKAMTQLVKALYSQTPPAQLIFISTTSVYGEQEGNITIDSPTRPNTASGSAHVEIERTVLDTACDNGYVLRLAGLTGPDRHPVKSLAGRSLSGADQIVNLIHVHDVVNVIAALMTQKPKNQLWHLCSNEHPMRGVYYPEMAKRLGLPAVEFSDEVSSEHGGTGKRIDPSHTLSNLQITLDYSSPWDMTPE